MLQEEKQMYSLNTIESRVLAKMRATVQVFSVRERIVKEEGTQTGLGREGACLGLV